jgi:hypothetical protein
MRSFCGAPCHVRHRNIETNDWGCQGVGSILFLWGMDLRCASKISYFCGAPWQVRHKNYFSGAFLAGAP